ncbi:MAG TPA: hypothetical protein VI408_13745 [Gaiellaceae bacterium]
MRRPSALLLMIVGQATLAMLAPAVSAVPAFATFLAAGLVLARN